MSLLTLILMTSPLSHGFVCNNIVGDQGKISVTSSRTLLRLIYPLITCDFLLQILDILLSNDLGVRLMLLITKKMMNSRNFSRMIPL